MNNTRLHLLIGLLGLSICFLAAEAITEPPEPRITFIELGSNNCIPCKQMKPVMKEIEEEFGDQVRVIFYDVWTIQDRKYADEYEIRLIPTQVFLDEEGREFHRHEGFYPTKDIIKLFAQQGVHPLSETESEE